MSVLVTGSTGFIGSHLVRLLAQRGETVHVLCRPTVDARLFEDQNIRVYSGDILDAASVERAMAGCSGVFHLAAYARNWAKNPRTFLEVNVGGMKNILDAAVRHGVKKVVYTSTSLTLGPSNGAPVNESVVRSAAFFTEYEYSKFIAEKEIRNYLQAGLNVVIVNPTRVFGPGLLNEGNSVTRMIHMYLQGKWRLVLGDGRGIGNYVFVDDIVRGHLLAMERGQHGERYILGGENISYNDFFKLLAELSDRNYRMFHVPPPLALAVSKLERWRAQRLNHYPMITPEWTQLFLADWACSIARAERELGYTITPLRQALATTIAWLERHNGKNGK